MSEQRTSKEVLEHLDRLFSGDTIMADVRVEEWRIVRAALDSWRIIAQNRAKVIKDLEGDLQVARLQRDAKRWTDGGAVPPSAALDDAIANNNLKDITIDDLRSLLREARQMLNEAGGISCGLQESLIAHIDAVLPETKSGSAP